VESWSNNDWMCEVQTLYTVWDQVVYGVTATQPETIATSERALLNANMNCPHRSAERSRRSPNSSPAGEGS